MFLKRIRGDIKVAQLYSAAELLPPTRNKLPEIIRNLLGQMGPGGGLRAGSLGRRSNSIKIDAEARRGRPTSLLLNISETHLSKQTICRPPRAWRMCCCSFPKFQKSTTPSKQIVPLLVGKIEDRYAGRGCALSQSQDVYRLGVLRIPFMKNNKLWPIIFRIDSSP